MPTTPSPSAKCRQCKHRRDEHYAHEVCPSFQPCGAIVYGDCYEQVCSCPDFKARKRSKDDEQ